ncbi:MAG: efflux RND transporter periplasmic adaptor subunit [Planctomycetota bacterium]|nr:efflux RND transporter periplasmic adaptor subunit [Planctomycetota bacterium]
MFADLQTPRPDAPRAGTPVLGVFAAALAALAALASCDRSPAPPAAARAEEVRTVQLAPIVERDAIRSVTITGTLYAEEDVLVAAKVPGRVVEISADLGDALEAGAILARIDETDYALAVAEQQAALAAALAKVGLPALPEGDVDVSELPEVARARAEEANAEALLQRAQRLYERTPPLISEQDFADIRTRHQVASTTAAVARLNVESLIAEARVRASALRTAQQRLADTGVIAPREKPLVYRVAERRTSVGEMVAPNQALFRIVATDRVKFRGRVPERYAGRIAPGAATTLHLDASAQPVRATVTRVSPAVSIDSRAFEIEIEARNEQGVLKPGSFARAIIEIGVEPDVRYLPADAVITFAGVTRVYSVRDGKAVEHRVELAPARDGLREVLGDRASDAGLGGVLAVVHSPGNLRAGQPVRVADRASDAARDTPAATPAPSPAPAREPG